MKVMILNFFRIKTPEEKELKLRKRSEMMRQQAEKYIQRG